MKFEILKNGIGEYRVREIRKKRVFKHWYSIKTVEIDEYVYAPYTFKTYEDAERYINNVFQEYHPTKQEWTVVKLMSNPYNT